MFPVASPGFSSLSPDYRTAHSLKRVRIMFSNGRWQKVVVVGHISIKHLILAESSKLAARLTGSNRTNFT